MGTVQAARPAQTLYVTIRRDELRQLKDERDQLKQELAQLRLLTQSNQAQPLPVTHRAASRLIPSLDSEAALCCFRPAIPPLTNPATHEVFTSAC